MIYREVASSSIMPLSAADTNFTVTELEKLFATYFYLKGPDYFNNFKSASFQSNSTFLKDLFNNINKVIKDRNIDEKQRLFINLSVSTIVNQLTLIEEVFSDIDNETLNAVICGCLIKHLKKYFS
jgi:hypothetical protein